ncbi:hypothetical protein NP284_18325 [Rhodopseudomonas pseudopalustris]
MSYMAAALRAGRICLLYRQGALRQINDGMMTASKRGVMRAKVELWFAA